MHSQPTFTRCSSMSLLLILTLSIVFPDLKLQVFDDTSTPSKVSVLDHDVEVVDSFVYVGSCIDVYGESEPDICRRNEKARSCMKSLDRNIWQSSISFNSLQTKIRRYNVYILPILLYGADAWSMTVAYSRCLDAFDQWCLRCIVHIPYMVHITNKEVRCRTGQPPSYLCYRKETTSSVRTSCESRDQDHSRILRAAINRPPADW